MSRFGVLQEQYQNSKKLWSDHWGYLVPCAEKLASDFGDWLTQSGNGLPDPLCPPVPVRVLSRYLNDEGEEVFGNDLSAGKMGEALSFAFEIELGDGKQTQPLSTLRLKLVIERFDDCSKVTVAESGSVYRYNRQIMPERLFDELFALCQEALDDMPA